MKILILGCDFDSNPKTNGAQIIRKILEREKAEVSIMNVFNEILPTELELKDFSGIVITGSRASVYENLNWVRKLSDSVRLIQKMKIPTLGICFGFQIVANALGGQVVASGTFKEGFEKIYLTIEGEDSFLFQNLPKQFDVYQSHGDIAKSLPKDSLILAQSDGSIQAYRFENFYCVQFHPEIIPVIATAVALRDKKDNKRILNGVENNYALPLKIFSNFIASL